MGSLVTQEGTWVIGVELGTVEDRLDDTPLGFETV